MIEGWLRAFGTETAAASAPAGGGASPGRPLPFARYCQDPVLVQDWHKLEASGSLPMQSHAFASALSSTLLAGAHMEVFFVREDTAVTALLALAREPGRFARWTAIGAEEVCEPHDALGLDPRAVRRLAEAIVRDARAVELDRIRADSPLIPAIREAIRGRGLVSVRPAIPSPTIALDSSWKDPASRFNSGRRSDLRRAARRADELGTVSFEMLAPGPQEFDSLFDEAVAVEARSWKREAGTALAADRAKESCFRHFFRSASERGTFRIAFMRIDGQAVAMQMALEWRGRFWLFKIGFDEDFGRCSPGTLLMLHSIGWAAGRGLAAYELLGDVEPWIARFWTREQNDCVCLRAYPFNANGAVALAADATRWLRNRLASGRA